MASKLGIDNSIPEGLVWNLDVVLAGLERIRAYLGDKPIKVLSGYRCPELNHAVGGSPRSQHLVAQAADIVCPEFGDPQGVAVKLAEGRFSLGIDQLILEASWVHVSFTLEPRHQVLRCVVPGQYVEGLA